MRMLNVALKLPLSWMYVLGAISILQWVDEW